MMLKPVVMLPSRAVHRIGVVTATEIPIQCSAGFMNALRLMQDSSIIRNAKIVPLVNNGVAVQCSGLVLKFVERNSIVDGNFILDFPLLKKSRPMTSENLSTIKILDLERNIFRKSNTTFSPDGLRARMFRTERDLTAKNSTLSRLKLLSRDLSKDKFLRGYLAEEQKIKAMLDDPALSTEEKGKIKVAFAEGYLNGKANGIPNNRTMGALKILQQLLSIVVFCILISMIAGSGSIFKLGTQQAINPETIKVTFEDVKGANDAKEELQEVVEFLKNPEKFSRIGGKLPKGVLLVGPPGTGKTLLARALAGEAGVPFFHTCGAEFDEMLVGQGARRVRDLFKMAKEQAPCVIFIDEIDAVGCKRTNTLLHPHANQTVNQLLAEMDGFHANKGVIVLGATNRRDDLDNALLRPGRFDLEINVSGPDFQGRKDIIIMYLQRVKSGSDVDVELLARGTVGFTGADIENMINQAAIRAGTDGADSVTMSYLEAARDKAIMGAEIRSRIPDEEANLITAYHEAGHTLVAYYTKHSQPIHKVTIVARGSSLGHTAYIPEKDKYHVTKAELLAQLDTMMGGRAAEELIFGSEKVTSGAASDLKSATLLACRMVKEWGMSDKGGLRYYQTNTEDHDNIGQGIRNMLDTEIDRILHESYERAKKLLTTHTAKHAQLAAALLKYESLDAEQVKQIFEG